MRRLQVCAGTVNTFRRLYMWPSAINRGTAYSSLSHRAATQSSCWKFVSLPVYFVHEVTLKPTRCCLLTSGFVVYLLANKKVMISLYCIVTMATAPDFSCLH